MVCWRRITSSSIATVASLAAAVCFLSATTQAGPPPVAAPNPHKPMNKLFFFEITSSVVAPDGVSRPVLLVNDQYPGPQIEVNRGDYVTVLIENKLSVPTAIHWHGMRMLNAPWYDGVPGQTQCPIPAGANFTYSFSTDDLVGTYWWHGHFMNQYIDGLVGALIIKEYPELDPFRNQYDEEMVVLLSDWYHQPTGPLLTHYLSPASQGAEPIPNNGLINGQHSFDCATVNPPDLPCQDQPADTDKAIFKFTPGKRYRLRVINTSAAVGFMFSIDNHQLKVIEVDGTDLTPVIVDRVPINIGQRYSVIVEANQQVQNYWMRAEIGKNCLPRTPTNLVPVIRAEVRYHGAGEVEPTTEGRVPEGAEMNPSFAEACIDMDANTLQPAHVEAAYGPVTQNVNLKLDFMTSPVDHINRAYINNITYHANAWDPTIMQNLNNVQTFATEKNVVVIHKRGEVVQVVIDNSDGGEHPFHLHGHKFQVVATGLGIFEEGKSPMMLDNPVRRDTATVPTKGFTVIRFVADNPGVWALHCHIEWHVSTGLVMQFLEVPDELRKLGMPKHVARLCDTPPPPGFDEKSGFFPEQIPG